MTDPKILVVDDKRDLAEGVALVLAAISNDITVVTSAEEALVHLRAGVVDLVVSDIRMPGLDGVTLMTKALAAWPHCRVILMTAYGTVESAVTAMRQGAYHYLTKPFDNEELLLVARRALDDLAVRDEIVRMRQQLAERDEFHGMQSRDRRMAKVFETIRRVAPADAAAMIVGESGTGKELVARAIHGLSRRSRGPLIAFNAGAVPDALAEAELFGVRRGAYTGADRDHDGLFLAAAGGTLFIDELGAMPLSLQGKVLRVLQEREVMRVGESRPLPVDVRVVTALNEDPQRLVQSGRLRRDLYYRLSVVRIAVPPLRERCEDIPLLAQRFLDQAVAGNGTPARAFAPEVLRLLVGHEWPGNVRELANVVQRAALMATGPEITLDDIVLEDELGPIESLGVAAEDELPYERAKHRVIEQFQRRYLEKILALSNGNVSGAARRAGLTRAALHRLIRRLDLETAN